MTQKIPETCILLGLQREAQEDASGHLGIILDVILFVCVYVIIFCQTKVLNVFLLLIGA